jgi:hypothetical protein
MMIPAGRNMPAAGMIGGLASYAASLGQVTRQSSSPRAIIPTSLFVCNSCSVIHQQGFTLASAYT